jgi:NADPH:quinone reductase
MDAEELMRAAQLDSFGTPLDVREVPEPAAGPDDVVVQLTHAGVNPLDVRICQGGGGKVPLPFTPGLDGVGAVDGKPVVVYGAAVGLRRAGTYAQRVAVPMVSVVKLPAGVDPVQAAGVGLAGVTAWGVVRSTAAVTEDDRVLVLGASGGVGTLVVQLARATGARVWAHVSSDADVDLQKRLGADGVVSGGAADLREATRALGPTVVIDGLGGAYSAAAVQAVKPGGRLVVFGTSAGTRAELDLATLYRKAVTVRGHAALMTTDHEVRLALMGCLDLVARGELRPQIGRVAPLREVNAVHRDLFERKVTGKLVLDVAA